MTLIQRFRGDTKSLKVTVKDSAGVVVPVDGCGLVLSVSELETPATAEEANYKLQKSGTVVDDGSAGQFEFVFVSGDVDFVGDYYYDMEFTDSAGKTSTLAKDSWTMEQDIGK